jgi:hypothetical protein
MLRVLVRLNFLAALSESVCPFAVAAGATEGAEAIKHCFNSYESHPP